MTSRVKQAEDVDVYCAECSTCFSGEPTACPECGAPQPDRGWDPLRTASQPYLGKIVDERYLLEKYIGGGASGRVYRAEDVKLNRPFALKILDLSGEGGSALEESLHRFENEVEALSRIRNPHVINIYESYRLEGETPAMLTEYIEGLTLEEMLEGEQRLDIESALSLIRQVANGLHEAHTRGVIHRDLKPANVMIEQLPAAGSFARILDFGLVHLSDAAGETRGFWGTPLYAAPEQCAPGPPITAATDIYSLGCVVFHCIAGEPPFVKSDARSIMRAHVDEAPPRLAEAADQRVPDPVDEIVAAMLEKDQDDRPEDMSEVIDAMEQVRPESGAWDRSVVVEESSDLEAEESEEALELDAPNQSTEGTRIGVAETGQTGPRIAQLLQSIDLEEEFSGVSGEVVTAQLDRTGDCVVLSDSEAQIFLMSTKGDSYFQEIASAKGEVSAIAPDITRGRVFAVDPEGRLFKWRLHASGGRPTVEAEFSTELFSLTLGANGQRIYVGAGDGGILRRDLRVGTTTRLCSVMGSVTSLHVSPSEEWLLAATENGGLYAVQCRGESPSALQLDSLDEEIVSLELDTDTHVAAAVDTESRLRLFHIRRSFGDVMVAPDVENLRTVALAPDNQIIAVSVSEPEVRVWRIRQERIDERLPSVDEGGGASVQETRAFGGRGER